MKVTSVAPFTRWMRTRFPFRYGIASMTDLPHLFLRVTVEIDGRPVAGVCSEGLPPKWFSKNPNTTFEEDLPEMVKVIRQAAQFSCEVGEAASVFQFWRRLYQLQNRWAAAHDIPPLLANLGVSLMERGVIDAFCRSTESSFGRALRTNQFGIDPGKIHPELEGRHPAEFLPEAPLATIAARHTVGLSDPLTPDSIPREDRAQDGLPQALTDCIDTYKLRFFKIKLCGDLDIDRDRLVDLVDLLERKVPRYRHTLDGNEQFRDMAAFRSHWDALAAHPELRSFLSREHLIFVEQPIQRDAALLPELRDVFRSWNDAPPIIIDESDAELHSLRQALELGYAGSSHKNCKGVIKGIINACYLAYLRKENPETEFILSGEDLANVGPVALLQDLAVMASLGISDVERNGHHYFKGLSAFPEKIQHSVAEKLHPDLYQLHPDGYAAVRISGGDLSLQSVEDAPFGTGLDPADLRFLGEAKWPE